jgi:hypothetical protein
MRPTQLPVQWVGGALSLGVKRSDSQADHSPMRSRMVELYLHSPTCLHVVVFNWLSTQTTLLQHTIFWDMMLCRTVGYWRFWATYCLHLQDWGISQVNNLLPMFCWLHGLFFNSWWCREHNLLKRLWTYIKLHCVTSHMMVLFSHCCENSSAFVIDWGFLICEW